MGKPLTLAFELSGNLIASADAIGKDAILSRRDGTAALRYRGLTAHDAAGRTLRSWLQVAGERLWLKWQYTGADGSVVGSADADPTVTVQGPVPCGETTSGEVLDVSAAGDSGYQYDADTGTWQFNWRTQGVPIGCYYIQVTSAQAQPSPLFPIQLE